MSFRPGGPRVRAAVGSRRLRAVCAPGRGVCSAVSRLRSLETGCAAVLPVHLEAVSVVAACALLPALRARLRVTSVQASGRRVVAVSWAVVTVLGVDGSADAEVSAAGLRLVGLDRLRGAAIVVMVVDHLCAAVMAVSGHNPVLWWVRAYPDRVAMPVFMVVSGFLLFSHVPSVRRRVEVLAAAVFVNMLVLASAPQVPAPEILVLWSLVMVLADAVRRFPVAAAVCGVLWTSAWPLGWDTYQPGVVLALVALGVIAARSGADVDGWGRRLPSFGLEFLGRHPLSVYVVHLSAVCVVVGVLTGWPGLA